MTDTRSANIVNEMKTDEKKKKKQYELHKLEKNTTTNANKKIYSDRNFI